MNYISYYSIIKVFNNISASFQPFKICYYLFYILIYGLFWSVFLVHLKKIYILFQLSGVFCICL